VLKPIGATTTTLLMEEMLARSCAVGHVVAPGMAAPAVSPMVVLSYSAGPAGSVTCSTTSEVLAFVRMHLDGGRAKDGTRVLSAKSAKAMQQGQVKLPATAPSGAEMGLGWILSEWDGERVMGHGGGTIGQLSFLQVLPDRRFAVCLLTNCSSGGGLWRDLGRYVFDEFAGVHMPETPKAPEVPPKLDLKVYTGEYKRIGVDYEVKLVDGQLQLVGTSTGALAAFAGPPQTTTCRPIDKELFLTTAGGEEVLMQFLAFDESGRPGYLYVGSRVAKRAKTKTKKR
jgi:CubicO group peptidase (beta-lactamase class C family)